MISLDKLFSFWRYLICFHVGKQLDWKAKVNFKIYDIKTWKQIITIHILPNISRNKGNQTMKIDQLIKYNMWHILLKNHTQNVMEKLVPDTFLKNLDWAYLWVNSLKFHAVCFYCVSMSRGRLLAFKSYKAFLKRKKRSGTSLPAWISDVTFEEKYFSLYVL